MRIDPRTHFIIPKDLSDDIINFTKNEEWLKKRVDGHDGDRKKIFDKRHYQKEFLNINRTKTPGLKSRVQEFASECYAYWGIEVNTEFMFGNFVSVTKNGNSLHVHKDPVSNDGSWHVRLNFLLQKPDSGGEPKIGLDKIKKSNLDKIEIEEGHSWINFASEWWHGSTEVIGDRDRIILSLGNYIEPNTAKKLMESFYRD